VQPEQLSEAKLSRFRL